MWKYVTEFWNMSSWEQSFISRRYAGLGSLSYFYYWEFGCACFFFQFCFVCLVWFVREVVESNVHPMVSSFNRSGKSTTPMVAVHAMYESTWRKGDRKHQQVHVFPENYRTIKVSGFLRRLWGLVSASTHWFATEVKVDGVPKRVVL